MPKPAAWKAGSSMLRRWLELFIHMLCAWEALSE